MARVRAWQSAPIRGVLMDTASPHVSESTGILIASLLDTPAAGVTRPLGVEVEPILGSLLKKTKPHPC